MAKQKGPAKFSGKIGDITFTSGKKGERAGKSATFTEKQKNDARERPQVKRTGPLNAVASPLRHALMHYNYGYVPTGFWATLLEAFRKERSDHRVLLLAQTLNLEVDPPRKFIEACPVPPLVFKSTARQYQVDTDISQPATVDEHYTCYFLQFIMIVWNNKDGSVRHMEEQTGWLSPKDRSPKFVTLKFKRTAADTEWILVCRLVQGDHLGETEYVTDCRMRIIATGTVSVESKKIIAEREKELLRKKNEPVEVREVKVKKKLDVRGKM